MWPIFARLVAVYADAAKAKYRELLDVLLRQNGVYVGSKEKRKLKARKGKPAR